MKIVYPTKMLIVHSVKKYTNYNYVNSDEESYACNVYDPSVKTSLERAEKYADRHKYTMVYIDNTPFSVKAIGMQSLNNGVNIYAKTEHGFIHVIKSKQFMSDCCKYGMQPGGELNSKYIFLRYGPHIYLAPEYHKTEAMIKDIII